MMMEVWIWGITTMRMGVWRMIGSDSRLRTLHSSNSASRGIRHRDRNSKRIIQNSYNRKHGRMLRKPNSWRTTSNSLYPHRYSLNSLRLRGRTSNTSNHPKTTTIAAEAVAVAAEVVEVEDRESRIARGRVHGLFDLLVRFLSFFFFFDTGFVPCVQF